MDIPASERTSYWNKLHVFLFQLRTSDNKINSFRKSDAHLNLYILNISDTSFVAISIIILDTLDYLSYIINY